MGVSNHIVVSIRTLAPLVYVSMCAGRHIAHLTDISALLTKLTYVPCEGAAWRRIPTADERHRVDRRLVIIKICSSVCVCVAKKVFAKAIEGRHRVERSLVME